MLLGLRFKISFTLLVLVAFVISIADMVFSLDISSVLFSGWFAFPVLCLAWLLAHGWQSVFHTNEADLCTSASSESKEP